MRSSRPALTGVGRRDLATTVPLLVELPGGDISPLPAGPGDEQCPPPPLAARRNRAASPDRPGDRHPARTPWLDVTVPPARVCADVAAKAHSSSVTKAAWLDERGLPAGFVDAAGVRT